MAVPSVTIPKTTKAHALNGDLCGARVMPGASCSKQRLLTPSKNFFTYELNCFLTWRRGGTVGKHMVNSGKLRTAQSMTVTSGERNPTAVTRVRGAQDRPAEPVPAAQGAVVPARAHCSRTLPPSRKRLPHGTSKGQNLNVDASGPPCVTCKDKESVCLEGGLRIV